MNLTTLSLILLIALDPLRAAADETFALVVTNNRSQVKHRPNLHYADDDGARYYRMFRGMVSEQNLKLLTRFDATSRRLFGDLDKRSKPPTRKQLAAAVDQIKRAVEAARKRGRRTLFYFVFAGHGHVQEGKGYLELEDGRLGPKELETMVLDQVKADVVHLLLDSCNSFFVINPRKPGGKRFATPKDMTRGFSKRYPHVGVFLSTSAAGEVYEWSEVQSGIFSHEVRSGLSGAADADGDGRVSYDELRAFVAVANKQISNEQYRPKVFSRGPWKKGRATLLTYRWARGTRLRLASSRLRMWVRGGQGTRLIDLHKERGRELEIVLPPGGGPYTVQVERSAVASKGRPTLEEYVLQEAQKPVKLAALDARPVSAQARGPEVLFAQLFRSPFGQRAYRAETHAYREDERLVFGLSWRDEVRMRHYLSALSRADRQDRLMTGAVYLGIGGLIGAAGSKIVFDPVDKDDGRTIGYTLLGTGVALAGLGVYTWLSRSEGEKAYDTFDDAIRRPGAERDLVLARTESHLHDLAAREARRRNLASIISFVGSALYFGTAVAIAVADERDSTFQPPSELYITAIGGGVLMLGLGVAMQVIETPMERMLRLYYDDPDLRINLGVAPTPGGGGAFALSGTF